MSPITKSTLLATLALSVLATTGCMGKLEKNRKLGIRQYNQGQHDAALASLNTALTEDEFDAGANTYAGLIHYRAGNLQQAVFHFKTALQADPSSERAKDGLTAAYIKQDKPDLALDALERATALAEKVDDPRREKSFTKKVYKKQVEENLYTHKVDDRLRIGRAYETLGDYDNAALYYKKALELTPNNAQGMLALAKLYEKVGNKNEAREYYRRAYLIDPATPGLVDAMTKSGLSISQVIGSR
jgi:tetratricopeptide (TPR) repeat protein